MSIDPGEVITGSATLDVTALSASWIGVDRIALYRDKELVQTVQGTSATFALDPDDDAAYWVIASGDTAMQPITSMTPWTMSAAILVDVDGNGWQAPLADFVVATD